MRWFALAMAAALSACAGEGLAETPSAEVCGRADSHARGEWLPVRGGRIWYSARGPVDAPPVVFLHGGPGYNSYVFERSVGERLAGRVRLVVLDQRGCGRSASVGAELGLEPTLSDLEALRRALGVERWTVVGHSFGGLLAVAYAQRHPDAVAGLVLVETTPDLPAAFAHQLQTAAAAADERWPEQAESIRTLAEGDGPAFDRLLALYGLTGQTSLQALLHWASPAHQARADRWDADSGLLRCTRPSVLEAFAADGLLDGTEPSLGRPLPTPGVLVGGRHSNVIGAAQLGHAAEVWGVEQRWMSESGHFPYVEEPAAFTALVADAAETFAEGARFSRTAP